MTPGFQMSFSATAALVALVEVWPRRTREISAPWIIVGVQRFAGWIFAAVAASLVAGMATGPFAMQHFNRTAVYGLIANLGVSPVADFVLMPALALGAALEPLGLGAPFLMVAGWGVDIMLAIGGWTASLPGSVRTVPSAPAAALPIAFLGVLFLCLWQGRIRWLGLPFAAAVLLWPRPSAPDIWIAQDALNAVYREGQIGIVLRPGVRTYGVDLWTRRRGLAAEDRDSLSWDCDRYGCAPMSGGAVAVSWTRRTPPHDRIERLCRSAEVVAFRARIDVLPPACDGRLLLDDIDFKRGGAVELWRASSGGWRAVWTQDVRGDRPWSRSVVSDSDG